MINLISEIRVVLISDWQTDRQIDICNCRVAFASENFQKNQLDSSSTKGCQLKNVPTGQATVAYVYLWKEQEFKVVLEVWPTLFVIFRGGGHTSSTFFISCSFQRYRLLSPSSWDILSWHPLFELLNYSNSLMYSNTTQIVFWE